MSEKTVIKTESQDEISSSEKLDLLGKLIIKSCSTEEMEILCLSILHAVKLSKLKEDNKEIPSTTS